MKAGAQMPKTTFTDWPQVVKFVSQARNSGHLLTNFYADEGRMKEWCADGSFSAVSAGNAEFLVHDRQGFMNLFYFANDVETLGCALNRFVIEIGTRRTIADVIGPDPLRLPVVGKFTQTGFSQISELVRMSRKTPDAKPCVFAGVSSAQTCDLPYIHKALHTHFEPEVDQLPSKVELAQWIAHKAIWICRNDGGAPAGFIIYELLPASLYLRYWFVEPAMRGKGVGSRLMNAMFAAAAHTRRQYFWVKSDNATAIDRYVHYGFAFERIKDTILAYGNPEKEQ
ncbi:MAG: GNAT family N-acetyltransferase [Kiritimatiellae bacterium]|nr:GNAT family N-acetyltransferase [Kiritimatiellia bacterium]